MLGCLRSNRSTLPLETTEEVWLSLDYMGNTSGSPYLRATSTCRVQVKGRGHGIMSLLIFNMTCSPENRLVVHSRMLRWRQSYECSPFVWAAPGLELVMTTNMADVSVVISDVDSPFRLHAQLKVVPERPREKLEIRRVTQDLGMSDLLFSLFCWAWKPSIVLPCRGRVFRILLKSCTLSVWAALF